MWRKQPVDSMTVVLAFGVTLVFICLAIWICRGISDQHEVDLAIVERCADAPDVQRCADGLKKVLRQR